MNSSNAESCLLVKTASEISLKGPFVRKFFTKKLVQSIKFSLKKNKIPFSEITRGGGRLYIYCEEPEKVQTVLLTVSGIHATAVSQHFRKADYSLMEESVLVFAKNLLKKGDSFALDVRVSSNKDFSSKDLENKLGAVVMKAIPGLKVNLSKPDKKVLVEIRTRDFFVYAFDKKGLGGLPLGVEGNVAMFFEGKEDELPAAFLLMHRGCHIFPIVKKITPTIEKHLAKFIPFNDYRPFIPTEKKDLQKLIEEQRIKAIATADSSLETKDLVSYEEFNKGRKLVVLRPLLLYPAEAKKKIEDLFK